MRPAKIVLEQIQEYFQNKGKSNILTSWHFSFVIRHLFNFVDTLSISRTMNI
jgi:hypothetical protein